MTHPRTIATLVAAKLTGKMPAIAALGRLDYTDRFQPFGQIELEVAVVYRDGEWFAETGTIVVPYEHPSPRIITHAGLFLSDRWLLDLIPKSYEAMEQGMKAKFSFTHKLPEITDG